MKWKQFEEVKRAVFGMLEDILFLISLLIAHSTLVSFISCWILASFTFICREICHDVCKCMKLCSARVKIFILLCFFLPCGSAMPSNFSPQEFILISLCRFQRIKRDSSWRMPKYSVTIRFWRRTKTGRKTKKKVQAKKSTQCNIYAAMAVIHIFPSFLLGVHNDKWYQIHQCQKILETRIL